MRRKISLFIIILFLSCLLVQFRLTNLKISLASSIFVQKNYSLQSISSLSKSSIDDLRQDFNNTFSSDWEIVNDKVTTKVEKTYWLVTLQPKIAGKFTVRYKFLNQNGSYSDNEYPISVGDRNCQRLLVNHSFLYPNICLGDKIIIPIQLESPLVNYSFSNASKYKGDSITNYTPQGVVSLVGSNLSNTLNYLFYLGKGIDETNPKLIKLYAIFSSKNTGKFNLETTINLPEILQPYALDAGEAIATPMEVLPAGTPLVLLPEREYSCQSAQLSLDSPCDPTSYRSFAYPQQKLRSRVGDRLNVEYALLRIPASPIALDPQELSTQLQLVEPVIEELSFKTESQGDDFFDSWLE